MTAARDSEDCGRTAVRGARRALEAALAHAAAACALSVAVAVVRASLHVARRPTPAILTHALSSRRTRAVAAASARARDGIAALAAPAFVAGTPPAHALPSPTAMLWARVLLACCAGVTSGAHTLAAHALTMAEVRVAAERRASWGVAWARIYLAVWRLPSYIASAQARRARGVTAARSQQHA